MIIAALYLAALAAQAEPASLTDPQIVKALETINQGELDAASIANSHAQSAGAKNFAAMMRKEHKQNLDDTKNLAKREKLGAEKSDLSEALERDAKKANGDIKKADKKAFDSAYMNEQIDMHQKAADTLKNKLIPAAKNDNLKRHLEETCKHVESHLAMAKTTSVNPDAGLQ